MLPPPAQERRDRRQCSVPPVFIGSVLSMPNRGGGTAVPSSGHAPASTSSRSSSAVVSLPKSTPSRRGSTGSRTGTTAAGGGVAPVLARRARAPAGRADRLTHWRPERGSLRAAWHELTGQVEFRDVDHRIAEVVWLVARENVDKGCAAREQVHAGGAGRSITRFAAASFGSSSRRRVSCGREVIVGILPARAI